MSGEHDPTYWRNLYQAPSESDGEIESTGFHVLIEAEDLVAERLVANEGEQLAAPAVVDPAAVTAIVNKLLKKRLAELAAKGMLVSPAPQRSRTADVTSAAGTSSAPSVTPAAAAPSVASAGDFAAEAPEDHSSTQVDDSLPPWEEAPEVSDMSLDTQASTVTIEDADVDEDELFVEVEDDDEDELFVEVEDDDEDEIVVAMDDEEDEAGGISALWSKVPILPGGQSSLIGVSGLSPTAPMVLVLIDGVSTLKGLKMLVPHVQRAEFEAIIEDDLARGLVVFD